MRPGYIALSSYSATSDGGALDKKQGPTGGMEMQFSRTLGRLSKRTEWRLLTGIALNGINNKIAADTLATLRTSTNFFRSMDRRPRRPRRPSLTQVHLLGT
ncbi:MAG: hypothetical protein EXS42_02635 [Lacunisphaera sp.]|nr:hypothetical protein [Lacunisphaera sp.]